MKKSGKNPIATVKEKYESKEKLVDKLLAHLNKSEDESKDLFKKRLLKTSNKKLLNLCARHKVS